MKVVFAKYNVNKSGRKEYDFTAYKKFSYFGKFHKDGFWYHNIDEWMCSMGIHIDDMKLKVKKFEDEIRKIYGAKVIWINGNLTAYKMTDGKVVIR